jgi:thiamine-monophosphate kinase
VHPPPFYCHFTSSSHGYAIISIMKVSKLGEFGLIDILAKMISDAKVDRLAPDKPIIGIGDDAAAWRPDGRIELATVDTMVQDIHFNLATISWRELGWKSLAINLSDIAAMGGVPEYALIALAIPEDTPVEDITALYDGIIEMAKESGSAIIGGNVSRAAKVSVTITVIGRSDGAMLLRSAARPGDIIGVTGYPGSAAAGMEMLTQNLKFQQEAGRYFKSAFVHPVPRLNEGSALLKNGIKAAIDISDGLLSDLRHICEESKVSARVHAERLPIHPLIKRSYGDKAMGLVLAGGEDYELIFTGVDTAFAKIKSELKCEVTAIGEITPGEPGTIELVDAVGKVIKTGKTGWQHF